MRLVLTLAVALACAAPVTALARPAPRWVQVQARDGDGMAGYLDMKSLKKRKHGRVTANGLLVPYVPAKKVDRLRVELEFDCVRYLHKKHRVVTVGAGGERLGEEADPSPLTQRDGLKTRLGPHELACNSKGWKKGLVFRSEEAVVAWTRIHAPLEPLGPAEPEMAGTAPLTPH